MVAFRNRTACENTIRNMEGTHVALDSDISTRGIGGGCIRLWRNCGGLRRNRQNFVLHLCSSLLGFSSQWAHTKGVTPTARTLLEDLAPSGIGTFTDANTAGTSKRGHKNLRE
jgi:hypothetical protein